MSLGLKDYWKDNKRNSLRFKLKNLKWELIYAWQRAWRGYDDMDVIEIQWTFVERCKKTLKDFRKIHHGLFNVPEEYRDIYDKLFFDDDETDIIIDMMLFHLEMLDEDHVEKILYGKNIYDDDYEINENINMFERYKRIYSVMNQNKEAFMKLFNLFFWDLYD